MCGIAGFSFTADTCVNARALARVLLEEIETRGREATGYAYVNSDGEIRSVNAPECASKFCVSKAFRLDPAARSVILHTRLATKGSVDRSVNNHPVFGYSAEGAAVAAVHNGCIYNDDTLFDEHSLTRFGEVDSEIIPAMIAAFGSYSYHTTFPQVMGSVATAWLDERTPEMLYAARIWDSPLVVAHLEKAMTPLGLPMTGVIFASTVKALTKALESQGLTWATEGVRQYEIGEGEAFAVEAGVWDDMVYPFVLPDMITSWSLPKHYGHWDDTGSEGIGSGRVPTGKPSPSVNVDTTPATNCYGGMFGAMCGVDFICPPCAAEDDTPAVLASEPETGRGAFWANAERENQSAQVLSDLADRLSHEPGYMPDAIERAAVSALPDAALDNLPVPVREWLAECENDYMMHMEMCGESCLWRDALCPVNIQSTDPVTAITDVNLPDDAAIAAAVARWGLEPGTSRREVVVTGG